MTTIFRKWAGVCSGAVLVCVAGAACNYSAPGGFELWPFYADSLSVRVSEVKPLSVVDFLGRGSLFLVTDTLPSVGPEGAAALDSLVEAAFGAKALAQTDWGFASLPEWGDYSPDYFVEVEPLGAGLGYNLYVDTRSLKAHVASRSDGKNYCSELIEHSDSANIAAIVGWIEQQLGNCGICDEEGTETPNDMPPLDLDYFKTRTSPQVAKGISQWSLARVALLDPMREAPEMLQSYAVVATTDTVGSEQASTIRRLLLSPESYKQTNLAKNATFLPDFACQFRRGKETIDVLVALYCDDLKVFYKDQVYTLDITPSHSQLAAFAQSIFPDDEYLKKY